MNAIIPHRYAGLVFSTLMALSMSIPMSAVILIVNGGLGHSQVRHSSRRVLKKLNLRPQVSFHKIWRGHDRAYLLQERAEKHAYLAEVAKDHESKCDGKAFELHAFCIMGNHVHEEGRLKGDPRHLSDHMCRAHACFGLKFNRRKGRLGKLAHSSPKTLVIQSDDAEIRCSFYIHTNPMRANIAKTPWNVRWRTFSSCRL